MVVVQKLSAEIMAILMQDRERLDPLNYSMREYDTGIVRHRNLVYFDGEERDQGRYRLDLYLPSESGWHVARPLVMFVHGGMWRLGSKDDLLGLYGRLGRRFAEQGIAFANVNYRLFPRVGHPGQIQDIARAFAWLHHEAPRWGYSTDCMFVSGHSAGAHLTSLLSVDPQWLAGVGLDRDEVISATVGMSGIYDVRDSEPLAVDPAKREKAGDIEFTLGPAIEVFPPGRFVEGSPAALVDSSVPPIMVMYEDGWPFGIDQAHRMITALQNAGAPHEVVIAKNEDHVSILVNMLNEGNVNFNAITRFIDEHC